MRPLKARAASNSHKKKQLVPKDEKEGATPKNRLYFEDIYLPDIVSDAHKKPMSIDPIKTETVTLRQATLADAPALSLVGAATFLEAFTWMLPGADILAHAAKNHTAQAYSHYLAKPETRITLALAGPPIGFSGPPEAPVGYAMLTAPELPTLEVLPTDIELKRIYLFSRFRAAPVAGHPGLRPAQALLNVAIAHALALHRTRLLLGTHASNLRAIAFYRRNGFEVAGTRTFQVGNQVCDDLIFARPLP
jgi:ribosomal protein S18 acetylase RimI-like enzyme